MTEEEWQTCSDRNVMMSYLCFQLKVSRKKVGRRKLRLYACGCCHRAWHLLDKQGREAVVLAERYAEGMATRDELAGLWRQIRDRGDIPCDKVCCPETSVAAGGTPQVTACLLGWEADGKVRGQFRSVCDLEERAQAGLLRCIFGNPFRPLAVKPSLLTDTVIRLADTIYNERAWDRMAILADALEERGAPPEAVAHCRADTLHARGCHVIDAIIGRE